MRKITFTTLAMALLLNAFAVRLNAQDTVYPHTDPENIGNWKLVEEVSDEFEGAVLDEDKWLIQGRNGEYRSNFKGREPWQYSTENVRLEDGMLKITTKHDPDFAWVDPGPDEEYIYTTAGINTKTSFKYGYMEIKCKLPVELAVCAFWTTGDGVPSELDVFESIGKGPRDQAMWSTIHDWSMPNPNVSWTNNKTGEPNLPFKVSDGFHIYSAEIQEDIIKIYADGELITTATREWVEENGIDSKNWPMNSPQRVWIDSEIFPWWGLPDTNNLPVDYEVEYIRVWQNHMETESNMLIANPGFETGNTDGWSKSKGDVEVTANEFRNGKFAGRVFGNGALEQVVNLKPNTSYTLSCWGKASEAGHNAYLGAKMGDIPAYNAFIEATDWTEYIINFTTNDTDTIANIWIWNGDAGHITFVDDVLLLEDGQNMVPAKSIELSVSESDVAIGEKLRISYSIDPDSATYNIAYWESSDTSIATVSSSGLVTGKSIGTVTINARTDIDSITASATIHVIEVAVTGITISPSLLDLEEDESSTLTVGIEPSNATNQKVTWSSGDENIAKVDENGLVTAVSAGTTTITATSDGNSVISNSITVNVTKGTGLKINSEIDVNVYPNPISKGSFTVNLPNTELHSIAIYNSIGQLVVSKENQGINQIQFNTEYHKLNTGMYFLTVHSDAGQFSTKIIIR